MTEAAVAESPKARRRICRKAAMTRWESVKEERKKWILPFKTLPIHTAMTYLEDLRKICEEAGHIMNERLNDTRHPIRCAGPHCGKDLTGVQPSGKPKWVAKKDFKDKNHPEIFHSLYFCCELHVNEWTRAQGGGAGGTGPSEKTV